MAGVKDKVLACFTLAAALTATGCALISETYSQSAEKASAQGLPPLSFSFKHSDRFDEAELSPEGKKRYYTDLVASRGEGKLQEEVTASYFDIKAHDGDPFDYLPYEVEPYIRLARKEVPGFHLVSEGPTIVNDLVAYQFYFTASGLPPGTYFHLRPTGTKMIYGRSILIPRGNNKPGGVLISIYAVTSVEVKQVVETGQKGLAKKIQASFEFED